MDTPKTYCDSNIQVLEAKLPCRASLCVQQCSAVPSGSFFHQWLRFTPLFHGEGGVAEQKLALNSHTVSLVGASGLPPYHRFHPLTHWFSTLDGYPNLPGKYLLNLWFFGPILNQFNLNLCSKVKSKGSGAESLSLYPGRAVPPLGQVFKLSVPPFSHGKKRGGGGVNYNTHLMEVWWKLYE